MQNEFVTVATFSNTLEAHTARNFLEVNGVRAFIVDEQTALQSWPNFVESKLQVPAEEAVRANQLLATVRHQSPNPN